MQCKFHAPNGTPCLQSNPGGLGEGGWEGGQRLLGKHAVHVQVARWRLAGSRGVVRATDGGVRAARGEAASARDSPRRVYTRTV